MLEVTARATELLADYFKDRQKHPVRLFVKLGGCGIRSFGVALEKPEKGDKVFHINGFDFVVNRVLLRRVQPIKVDSDGFGFRISASGIYPQSGCGNCGYLCSDGRRCTGQCATCEHPCSYGRTARAGRQ